MRGRSNKPWARVRRMRQSRRRSPRSDGPVPRSNVPIRTAANPRVYPLLGGNGLRRLREAVAKFRKHFRISHLLLASGYQFVDVCVRDRQAGRDMLELLSLNWVGDARQGQAFEVALDIIARVLINH